MTRTQACVCALVALSACGDEGSGEDAPAEPALGVASSGWEPFAATELYEGKSLAEWGVEYARWAYAQTSCDSPSYDQTGELCGLYQDSDSPVFFLEYSTTERLRTKCRIPAGKSIVVPVMTFMIDNAGDVEEPWTDDEMLQISSRALESMRDLELRVDGNDVDDLTEYRIEPTMFDYEVPSAPNWYSCNGMSGVENVTVSPSYFSGYMVVLPPPAPGVHELRYAGVLTYDGNEYALDTRTRFIVER